MNAERLWEQVEAKSKLWNSLVTTKRFFDEEGDKAMFEKLQIKSDAVWEEYTALFEQWKVAHKAEHEAVVTLPDVPAGDGQSVTFEICEGEIGAVGNIGQTGEPVTWRQEIVEEAIREDAKPKPKSKLEQLQAAFDDAKPHCLALPSDGKVEYAPGTGYCVWFKCWHGHARTYHWEVFCWLGSFDRGMRFLADAKEQGKPNFASLRVGVR